METLPLTSVPEAEGLADLEQDGFAGLQQAAFTSVRAPWAERTVMRLLGRVGSKKAAVVVLSLAAILAFTSLAGHPLQKATVASSSAKAIIEVQPQLQVLQGSAEQAPDVEDVMYPNGTMHLGISPAYGTSIQNYGKDCWSGCQGKAGFCQDFCGPGNACCMKLEGTAPPECHGITDFGVENMHTCVAPVNPVFFVKVNVNESEVKNWGKDCMAECGADGFCQAFCGTGNACCKYGIATDRRECMGVDLYGTEETYTCVKPVVPMDATVGEVMDPDGTMKLGLSPAYGLPVENFGKDCWEACGNAGFCQEFCGQGNACCRYMGSTDPPECHGITEFGSRSYHTCVAPVNPAFFTQVNVVEVEHWGEDCLQSCADAGYCQEFCGMGNACCKFGESTDPAECWGVERFGAKDRHTCVKPVRPEYVAVEMPEGMTIKNWGQDCWPACKEAGLCQEFCGMGNACCKFGESSDPPECHDVYNYGSKDRHTCVAPEVATFKTVEEPTDANVQHWGQDCWDDCDGAGYCPDFCGLGNACCRFGSTKDPVECQGIAEFGSKDRHTCVTPANPVWKVSTEPAVMNWGEDCWEPCNEIGGVCPNFCGPGNACCRFGSPYDPPECHGVQEWGAKDHHTCIRPIAQLYLNHLAEDCWTHCDGAGLCEDWCGSGNACCRFYEGKDPDECKGVSYWPTHAHHTCVRAAGLHPGVPPPPAEGECIPGETHNAQGNCKKAENTTLMTFYMYRATNDEWGAHLENANLGNIEGILWFLHNEVVTTCPRKENINRILRYVVTMRNPATLIDGKHKPQFGTYTEFQHGKCMYNNSDCSNLFKTKGYAVGCKPLDTASAQLPNYAGPPQPVWYSLPGRCVSQEMDNKGDKPFGCWTDEPGGMCISPDGTANCTWKAEYAGEIRVDELSGITDPGQYCAQGNIEYNNVTDKGIGTTFWNVRRSAEQGKNRVDYVRGLFQMKYPNYPATLGEPICEALR